MKRIIFSFFVIVSAFTVSISAQTFAQQRFEKGLFAAENGNYRAALGNFKMSLAFLADEKLDNEFRAKIHYNIGVCFYQMKEQTKAIAEFERAVKLNPNHEKSFYSLGMAQYELKNWKAAERAFRKAVKLNRRNGETWFDLAFVYLAQKDYDAAQTAFQKAVKLKSIDSATAHNNLGVILVMNGDMKAAITEFEAALRKSNGGFAIAERNLQFCKSLGQNAGRELLAKLEFGK
jgi:tetratricopeptide (TPR) repeat protein